MSSIRRHLIIVLTGAVTMALLLVGFAIYRAEREGTDELFDYHLRQIALSLREPAFQGMWMPPVEADPEGLDLVMQVWDAGGVRLYYSHPHRELPGFVEGGYANVDTREGTWRVFAIRSRSQVIQVAQPLSVRERMALAAAARVLLPLLLLLPCLGLAIWLLVTRGLAPLDRLARAVASRTPKALEPLPERQVPEEVLPLVHSLNGLLDRLEKALAAQRAFIADAAHELRTPIAALQLQAQLIERAQSDAERKMALDDLKSGIHRAGRLVQQLLTLARQEPDYAPKPFVRIGLADIAKQVVTEYGGLANAKAIDLGVPASNDAAVVFGDPDDLRVLTSNLMENALRYTPEQGRVDVAVRLADGCPMLEVSDTGPGIFEHELTRVFDRFYRGEQTRESGTGLGLAIVKAIADRHDATIELRSGRGLRVRVKFPDQRGL
ncbi:sensor histidine kinase [Methylomagnum sp.]